MSMTLALLIAAAQAAPAAQPAPAPAPTPDWRPIGTFQGRFALFYDAARVERGGEVVTVRTRRAAAAAPEASPVSVSRVEIRCADRMLRVVETTTYAPDGAVAHVDTVPQPFESIPPTSIIEVVRAQVC